MSTASLRAGFLSSVDIVVDGQRPCWSSIDFPPQRWAFIVASIRAGLLSLPASALDFYRCVDIVVDGQRPLGLLHRRHPRGPTASMTLLDFSSLLSQLILRCRRDRPFVASDISLSRRILIFRRFRRRPASTLVLLSSTSTSTASVCLAGRPRVSLSRSILCCCHRQYLVVVRSVIDRRPA